MRFRNFFTKLINVLLLAGVLFYYQSVAVQRAEAVEANRAAVAEAEAYNDAIRLENEAAERAARGETEPEPEPDAGLYVDGVYEGEGTGYGGVIRVRVTVSGGAVTDIEVTEHGGEDPAYYMLAEAVVDNAIAAQSADVDGASGATFSSAGLRQAIAQALEQAVR